MASTATWGHRGSLGFDLAFFYYSFPFSPPKRISILEKIRSIRCACSNISVILALSASCLINANNRLSLHVDEANIKIQRSCCHRLCITFRLKGPWSLVSFCLACYKNNLGYKCLHSTNFISKAASLLSRPNKSTSTHAQIAFLFYFCSVARKDR